MAKEWDIFISHASEDNRTATLPLAEALRHKGLTVWIDERELSVGDSLRERINEGIARSRYGVVILSPSFLDKHWPKNELNALLAREENGRKILIPVRHEISQTEVARDYPLIADRLSLSFADGLELVVDKIVAMVGRPDYNVAADIAIDFSHGQRKWNFLESSLEQYAQRIIKIERGILEQPELLAACRVLVMPPPMQIRFTKPEIDKLANWVDAGGGLLLMGCYDERHHSSNFSELAWQFDYDIRHDLLLPSPDSTENENQPPQNTRSHVLSRDSKYAVKVTIDPRTTSHPIVNEVSDIAFLSATSIEPTSTENPELTLKSPKSTWIMRPIGHIQPDGSRPAIDHWEPDRQGEVILLASRKWNRGRVVVSGTWKLWTVEYGDNSKLLENIIKWLSGR